MVAPGAARLVIDEIQALPPPAASRMTLPNTVVSMATPCSCSPFMPMIARLAVAFRLVRREQRNRELADLPADLLARLGQRAQVPLEFSGKRIVDDRDHRDLAQRRVDRPPGFDGDIVNEGQACA